MKNKEEDQLPMSKNKEKKEGIVNNNEEFMGYELWDVIKTFPFQMTPKMMLILVPNFWEQMLAEEKGLPQLV